MDHALYENHLTILRSELSVALGCTEPIAIAYAAAKARELLEQMPVKCVVSCSGNIIKNVMGVTVPNSGGLKGIDVAATLGIAGGHAERELAVLKLELDEREAALRPEKTVTNLVWTSQEDVVFDASGVARKVQKKVLLPENDPSIPPASRAFAKTHRIVAERNADLEAAVRSNVVSRLERLYRNALRDDRIVEAECYLSELKRMYPDWGKTKESK